MGASASFRHRLKVWIWDLVNAFLSGIATGLLSVVGGEAVGAIDFSPRQLLVVSVVGGVISAANYIRQRRLPEIDAVPEIDATA